VAAPDPIAEAEVLLAYGQRARALALLKEAAAANPDRSDIRTKLESLASGGRDPRPSTWAAVPHFFVAWVLVLFSILLVGSLVVPLTGAVLRLAFFSDGTVLSFLGIVAVGAAAVLGATYGAVVLFLHVWFAYLNLLPAKTRMLVDARLPKAIAAWKLEPLYSRIRSKAFKPGDDT